MPKGNGIKMEERNERGQFVKGWKGGPGRPEGTLSLTTIVKQRLQELTNDGRSAAEMLADNIIQDALESNNKMRTLIWNYVDGMPRGSNEGGGNKTLIINITPEYAERYGLTPTQITEGSSE